MLQFRQFISEKTSLAYHDKLNEKIWSNDTLRPDVRKTLLTIAEKWREFASIPKSAVKEVQLTGGNANYNYTDLSDLDVHLITDYSKVGINKEFASDYLFGKKSLWADAHNITVKGYPVELYAQPLDELPHPGQGVYSLSKDKWVQKPDFLSLDFSKDNHLERKTDYFIKRIDSLVDSHSDDVAVLKKIKDKIRSMRNSGIQKGGEFAFENLVFKELRNKGYIDKLSNYIKKIEDKNLSLD
jgi:hypothetical protein